MIESIFSPKLTDILPPSVLADEKLKASAEALDVELEKLSACVKEVLHLPRLDELNSDVLDHLAWQWHVDGYDFSFDDETKRKMIRESIYLHRIKGTPAAVEMAAKSMLSDAEVSEWFDYGGKPYFFKITAKGLKYYGDDGKKFLRVIFAAKNVRSWLEDITIDLTIPDDYQKLFQAIAEISGGEVVTEFESTQAETFQDKIFHATAEVEGGEVITELTDNTTGNIKLHQATCEFVCGYEETDFDRPAPPDTDNIFAHYLLARWKRFKKNPLINFYCDEKYFDDGDFEFFPDDKDVFEIFPDANFIRLYFKFPDDSVRSLTMLNPKNFIPPIDLKLLSDCSADKKVLINSAGLCTTGIKKVLLISQQNFELL